MKKTDKYYYILSKILADDPGNRTKGRIFVRSLAVFVVFVMTYMLVLPAFTLDQKSAAEQGGIDVPAAVQEKKEAEPSGGGDKEAKAEKSESDSADKKEEAKQDSASSQESKESKSDGSAEASNNNDTNASDEKSVENSSETGKDGNTDESANIGENEDEKKAENADKDKVEDKDKDKDKDKETVNKLVFKGEGYTVTVSGKNAEFPADTKLKVREIERKDDAKLYDSYEKDAKEAIKDEDNSKKAPEFAFARFYDITMISGGSEYEPKKPVEVNITYDKDLQKDLKAEKSENVRVIHFAEKKDKVTPEVIDNGDIEVKLSKNKMAETTFAADSFSVYGVVCTEVIHADFLASNGELYDVTVRYDNDAKIPDGSTLQVTEIEKGTKEYNKAYELVTGDGSDEDTEMLSVDISIISPEGMEIEPESPVTVDLTLKSLPDGADPAAIQDTIEISHLKEKADGVVLETVASGSEISVSETIEASFKVDSFSQFNITWNNGGTRATIRVHYVDEDGNDLNGQQTTNINKTNNSTQSYSFETYASLPIDDADYIEARLGSASGQKVTSVTFQRERWISTYYYYTRFYNGNTLVSESSSNQTYDVYLVYESTAPGLTVTKTTTGATTPATATFTVSSTDGQYSRSFTYADMTNGKIKLDDAPVGKTYTVTESGADQNGYILTTTYGSNATLTPSNPSGRLTVNNAYANDPNVVKVYVYVAAKDTTVTPQIEWKNSPEFLELLGISGDTVDTNNYFPVGEIYLDRSFFNGKTGTTTGGHPLINSQADWEDVLAALGELNTTTLVDQDSGPYSENRGNSVGDYMSQAAADIGKGWGSESTALFYWPTSNYSYGFDDQSVRYHLDLRFQTNKVTFIAGNNGISSEEPRDGTTVDVRSYIKGSPILEPRNLPIPAGYRFVGYYNDPNFTTPWDKIGSPLEHDETVYIKITPQDNVILYYKPVPAGGGTVSVDAEGLNPETGTPAGSTATANPGYTFDGWYADEECTQLLSRDARYVPTKGSSDRWVDGTTYYAKFKENTVTLTFVAEEHVDHLEMASVPDNVVSYEFSEDRKTLTVVLEAASGSPVTVKGVAEDGFAIKEWTIDGRTGNLTTADSLTTAKTDDPAATNLWTDRTYHVWAEVLKTITVTKEVHIIGSLHADDVDATVYFALKDKNQDPAPWVRNADGTIYTTSIHIVNGVPESTAQFTDLPAGTYEVWEVADTDANTLAPGSEIAEGIFVSRIQTWISDTDTGNNVVVTDDDPHGEIKVINTLNHSGEAMTFRANKKWYTSKNSYADPNAESNVDVPEGAWVDFTLYRVYSTDGHEEEVETIRLDGTPNVIGEEAAWGAAFRDLATVDEDDHPVSYYVKETAMADLSEFDYYTTFNDTTYTNGGSISNVVAYGEVNATKEIELPANISNADKQAFIDSLMITVTGPAEVAESRRVTRTLDKDSFEVTESRRTVTYGPLPQEVIVLTLTAKAEDLPAGTYTITESGYDDDSLAYNWDSAHSWIKADKLPAEQAALANQEQYGKDSIDAQVGVNVTDGNFTTKVGLLNSYVVQDVKVTKVWDDMGQEGADHPSVNMTLYRTDGSGNRTAVSTQIIGANQTGDNLTLTWANMPQNYTYSVEEAPLRGYRLESITGDQTQGFIVTNQKATTIKVVKTDQSGDALAGAVFSGDLIDGTVTTEITGEGDEAEAVIIEDAQVPLGEYTVTEDAPPAGYYPLDGPVVISVDQGEAGSDVVVTAEINGRPSSSVVVDRPDKDNRPDYWVVTIKNSSGVELPNSGGIGTTLFYVLGSILLLGSLIVLAGRARMSE